MANYIEGETFLSVQESAPTTGQTVTLTRARMVLGLINPAGTLAALTVVLPASSKDGDICTISTSQIITALTITGTIVGTLTTLALGGTATFIYSGTSSKWFRG